MSAALHPFDSLSDAPPEPRLGLEEATGADPRDWPQAAAFALARAGGRADDRPLAVITTAGWRRERGGFSPRGLRNLGLDLKRLIQVRAGKEDEALWAMEEVLKSGAVSGAVASVETASFLASKRLDFAARAGGAVGVLLRAAGSAELSAARLRWRVGALASAAHPYDPEAPGLARLRVELTRRRDGPLGAWTLEQDHETHTLRLAAGLADHGLDQGRRTIAA